MALQFFKARFALFLRSRHTLRHFRRHLMLESLDTHGHAVAVPPAMTQALRQASKDSTAALLARVGSQAVG
ncbi:MAG: hypothetical protein IPJ36_17960 [Simplicispira sp.]|nr:hypothetical protein [Simplicispira sp.]